MLRKLLLTIALSTFGLLVPVLEISETHVFNPLWPAHARLHEMWQLITNSAFAAIGLWLAWHRYAIREAAVIGLVVVGGFLGAWILGARYGGSMLHTDGTEIAIGGINIAVAVMIAAAATLAVLAVTDRSRSDPAE